MIISDGGSLQSRTLTIRNLCNKWMKEKNGFLFAVNQLHGTEFLWLANCKAPIRFSYICIFHRGWFPCGYYQVNGLPVSIHWNLTWERGLVGINQRKWINILFRCLCPQGIFIKLHFTKYIERSPFVTLCQTLDKVLISNLYWEGRGAVVSGTDGHVVNWCSFIIQWDTIQQQAISTGSKQTCKKNKEHTHFLNASMLVHLKYWFIKLPVTSIR